MTDIIIQKPIELTEGCISKLKELILEENNPLLKLRIFVQGGGCSGFSYGFSFEETTSEDDLVYHFKGVTVLVDSMSLHYLTGALVDYKEDLSGSQFTILNPNATTTCGCGSSFSV